MPKDFLEKIVKHKKEEVKKAKKLISESQLQKKARAVRNKRPFFDIMKDRGPSDINIIAEIKRASPSKGPICQDLNPELYAKKYELGGAAALSVLTDGSFFKGSLDDLKLARKATSLAVLRKDFLISSYQIYESAAIGADAVLLIARILSKEQIKDYMSLCCELNLDVLFEIHTKKDIEYASWAGAKLIGINNRNLRSFETDIKTAVNLVSELEPDQIPVAASGISCKKDIKILSRAGIYNFLIGESLVKADDTTAFLKSLLNTTQ